MPFIGRDWRSPGEAWVKTDEGWERMKILESTRLSNNRNLHHDNHGFHSGDSCSSSESDSDNENENFNEDYDYQIQGSLHTVRQQRKIDLLIQRFQKYQDQHKKLVLAERNGQNSGEQISTTTHIVHWQPMPYCHITLKSTKEVAGYNTISEAFYKLDFCNAIRDIRRFNYISKLLHLLITQNLTSLSGCATKVLFTMLEQVAWQVASNQQNIHILHTLLHDLKKIMRKYYCWGRPLGSTLLWEQHLRTIERICQMANQIEIKQPPDDGKRLTDLPEELIREILLRLSDYKDLINSGQASDTMKSLLDEEHIWRQLCKYHFTRAQLRYILGSNKVENVDWEQVFHQLRKKFGLKEEYADCLFLCRHCRCLFWKSFGHPCIIDNQLKAPNSKGSANNLKKQLATRIQQKAQQFQQAQNSNNANNGQNMLFFRHPLVQQFNNRNANQNNPSATANNENDIKITPQHIPVPPQAFLKFFSL